MNTNLELFSTHISLWNGRARVELIHHGIADNTSVWVVDSDELSQALNLAYYLPYPIHMNLPDVVPCLI